MNSACGVICSDCPAFQGTAKGYEYQNKVVEAWHQIYSLNEAPEHINCGGCLGSDEEVFYTSRGCVARRCCKSKGYSSCAECPIEDCPDLEKAQAVWDEVPMLINTLSAADFETYARPYCDHRLRLAARRAELKSNRSVTESNINPSYFHCCGDEDLYPFKCERCGHIMVFCYECDSLFPNLSDTNLVVYIHENPPREPSITCPSCGNQIAYASIQAESNKVSFLEWLHAGYQYLLIQNNPKPTDPTS